MASVLVKIDPNPQLLNPRALDSYGRVSQVDAADHEGKPLSI